MTGRALCALPVLLIGCVSSSVMAPPKDSAPTYFWGIRKACKRDAYLSSAVEKRLFQMDGPTGGEVRRIFPGATIENAWATQAGAEFRRTCRYGGSSAPQSGVLIGGRVEERGAAPPFIVMRLFRVDLATQQIVYRDHFCRSCDSARTLSTQAAFLLEAPSAPAVETPQNLTFCTTSAAPPRAPIAPILDAERVTLAVRSSDKRPRAAQGPASAVKLVEALKQHVQLTGRDVVPAGARYTLTVELTPDGGAQIYSSSRGGSGQGFTIARPKSAPGAVAEGISEALVDRVVRAAGRLLDEAAATDAVAEQSPQLFELPLSPAIYAALCQSRGPECVNNAANRLDSEPTLSPFLDPQCGEVVSEEPAR
jgi:hypothetical protein